MAGSGYDRKRLYRQRTWIERLLGHLKINRAVATRYDQRADGFLGMPGLATARYRIKYIHAASVDVAVRAIHANSVPAAPGPARDWSGNAASE
jgi:hypothetical protein